MNLLVLHKHGRDELHQLQGSFLLKAATKKDKAALKQLPAMMTRFKSSNGGCVHPHVAVCTWLLRLPDCRMTAAAFCEGACIWGRGGQVPGRGGDGQQPGAAGTGRGARPVARYSHRRPRVAGQASAECIPPGADCIPLGAECIPPGASALSPDRAPSGHRAAALETSRAASPLALQPSSTSSRVGAAVAVGSSTAPVAEATAGSEVGCGGCSGKTAPRERERSLSTYLETGSVLIEAATDTEQVAAAMATLAPLVPGLHYFRSPPPSPPASTRHRHVAPHVSQARRSSEHLIAGRAATPARPRRSALSVVLDVAAAVQNCACCHAAELPARWHLAPHQQVSLFTVLITRILPGLLPFRTCSRTPDSGLVS